MNCLEIDPSTWSSPALRYPRERDGNWRLRDTWYPPGYYNLYGLRDVAMWHTAKRLRITELQEKRGGRWHDWMVDDPPHWLVMQWYASQARGRVLTAGLGLGLVHHALAANEAVTDIVVVERQPEVIRLVGPHVPARVEIYEADFFEYALAPEASDFQTIILDLWVASGVKQKMQLLGDVLVRVAEIRMRYPNTTIFTHGFTSACDYIWPMSDDTKRVLDMIAHG